MQVTGSFLASDVPIISRTLLSKADMANGKAGRINAATKLENETRATLMPAAMS